LNGHNIRALVEENENERGRTTGRDGKLPPSALYKIWLDHKVSRFTNQSISTVKADAARKAFGALGKNIVWAVVDTGVDKDHPHFISYRNLELELPLQHRDFTGLGHGSPTQLAEQACEDKVGHGTHVAGIIAGEFKADTGKQIIATVRSRDQFGEVKTETITEILEISGMAPQCKLLSLKVLDDDGDGLASNLIAALEYIQDLNGHGRLLRVHGVNMSVGYDFEPKWFACGQSPLCVEVDRLVRSGVVVVVAAGNTGYGYNQPEFSGPVAAGLDLTINDPGNAQLAITVGSTHREMPHMYGVSYFSSKGPTGDGRLKPDLVAPGEKILSCRSRQAAAEGEMPAAGSNGAASSNVERAYYKEDSGTSMAAPHVSGVIAAFLSIRREFIGKPDAVKEIFLSTATDLNRAVYFQGKGLVDLMRAIQSV
jgi:subtilisin family serine protease